jgi:hypothetical protein
MATSSDCRTEASAPSPRTLSDTPPGISIAEAIVALSPIALMT